MTSPETPPFDGLSLRIARLHNGLSARELAEAVGCSERHIYALEHNRRQPSLRLRRRLEDVLGLPPSFDRPDSLS